MARGSKKKLTAADLGIDLKAGTESEIFKWFLACILFGRPIQQKVAKIAFDEMTKEGVTTPEAILAKTWEELVAILDRGHYVRFDYSEATHLISICEELLERYGTVSNMIDEVDRNQLMGRMEAFKWIGPTTAGIFVRDLVENRLVT